MWLICSEAYSVDHNMTLWEGATINTFVHLWSIIDRTRTALEGMGVLWIVEGRTFVGYCADMGAPEPLDTYMYQPESRTPVHIQRLEQDLFEPIFENTKAEVYSYYDFCMSTTMNSTAKPLSIEDFISNRY